MKLKHIFGFLVLLTTFLASCGECEKLNIDQAEKDWVTHFKIGQRIFYKNAKGQIDTIEITTIRNLYTPCNRVELSKYQYEKYFVLFKLMSKENYDGNESSISMTTEEWKKRIPYIYFGNLGPHRNDLENKVPVAIDTVLGGVKLTAAYYYAKGLNTEQYGETERFKNFFRD